MEDEEERKWRDACLFMSKGPSLGVEFADEDVRVELWAYWEQAIEGPGAGEEGEGEGQWEEQGLSDGRARKRREARRRLGQMQKSEARRMFVALLSEVLPGWREWCREHGRRIREEQEAGGEAQRILAAFALKTGFKLSSKL